MPTKRTYLQFRLEEGDEDFRLQLMKDVLS